MYTKGEWKVKTPEQSMASANHYIEADGSYICKVIGKANAHLIAASPKLHKDGKNALVSLKLWASEHPDDVLAMVITELEYALAKAEGK